MSKKALVLGAGGFIGGHLVMRLLRDGYAVTGVDIKLHEYINLGSAGCNFRLADLRHSDVVEDIVSNCLPDEVYQLAADMGGAGFVFTGDNDADIMHNSAMINLNVVDVLHKLAANTSYYRPRVFYSSSACMYPAYNQEDPANPLCSENSAYPAAPDSEYGWEKLFSERLFLAYSRNKGLDVRIARFHNIFGPQGTWTGGREKAPAALCRKVAEAPAGGTIQIWGDGQQTRSFLYIDECVEGIMRLMSSDFVGPVNIGSEEMVTIDQLAKIVMKIAGKDLSIEHVSGPVGVRGRCSDNKLIQSKLNWKPTASLEDGLRLTYAWIKDQVSSK